MHTYTIKESLRKRLIENREHAQVRELLRNLTPNSGEVAAPSNLVNGLTEAETDESMSVRGLSQKAVPSYELPSIPWSKEAEMRKAWAAPSTSHSRDDVIRMARKSCDTDKVDAWRGGFWVLTQEELERFAALAAAPSTSPDAQDAARYRWLRDSESIVSPGVDLAYDAHRAAKLGNPKIIDAAIDDAIKGGA